MFFLLSKILSFLTAPTTWIILLLTLSIFTKRKKIRKTLRLIGVSLLLLFTNPFLSSSAFSAWEIEPTPLKDIKKHDIAVVFSGMTLNIAPEDRIYFNKAADRITMALHLYKIGKVNKILISGGLGTVLQYGRKESESLKEFLLMLGVPESDILQETEAKNTYQNAQFTKDKLDKEYPNAKLILITSAFHMRRSYGCAQKAGLECTPFAVDYHVSRTFETPEDIIVPKSSALYNWDILCHEMIGYGIYWMTGKL